MPRRPATPRPVPATGTARPADPYPLVPARKVGGLILIGGPDVASLPGMAAVSSPGQRPDLDRQVARVTSRAAARSLPVGGS
jgi:hypothetical protein